MNFSVKSLNVNYEPSRVVWYLTGTFFVSIIFEKFWLAKFKNDSTHFFHLWYQSSILHYVQTFSQKFSILWANLTPTPFWNCATNVAHIRTWKEFSHTIATSKISLRLDWQSELQSADKIYKKNSCSLSFL